MKNKNVKSNFASYVLKNNYNINVEINTDLEILNSQNNNYIITV